MLATLKLHGRVSTSSPLLTTAVVFGLTLVACHGSGTPSTERRSRSAAVAVTGGGITADVVAVEAWSGGFNGAVRLIDTSFSSPISSFAIVFKLGSGSVTGVPWNGTITGPDASGNYTATEPSWLQNQPIQPGQTWNVGFNGGGTFTSSTIVSVTINGQPIDVANDTDNPPVVSLASSATTVIAASSVTLNAIATDDQGVAKVEFYVGTTLLGTATTAPYTLTIPVTQDNNGSYALTARAYDTIGQATTSAPVNVTVSIGTNGDTPPVVSLTSSATTITTAGGVTLTATASDDKGVTKVEFYVGTLLLGTDATAPYTLTIPVTQGNNGSYAPTARAYDTIGQVTTSAPVTVMVNIGGGGGGSYAVDPPDACYNQYWVKGCESGACGGRCQVANACSPPEDPQKASLPMTFACPRFMMYSDEMAQAAKDDWGADPPFVYGVVGHDADQGGLDTGSSSCCQCYQLVFERPEPGSAQPPALPIPEPMIVQSFNTAAGGGKNFDIFMGAGGFGAFNACVPGNYAGTATTNFGHFMYSAFPTEYPTNGGIKAINIPECKVNGAVTEASMQSPACQGKINSLCNNTAAASSAVAAATKTSCIETNAFSGFYHQNWQVRAKRIECPVNLTRVTGCRLKPQGLPTADPNAKTAATADSTFKTGYTTTTMQDCCKPSCAWADQVGGAGLQTVDKWTSFYSCDQNGAPITAP